MVKFRPICTATRLPPISTVVLPLRYQPSEPVEKPFFSAKIASWPLIDTFKSSAFSQNSARLIGQVVFLAMRIPFLKKKNGFVCKATWADHTTGRQGQGKRDYRGCRVFSSGSVWGLAGRPGGTVGDRSGHEACR